MGFGQRCRSTPTEPVKVPLIRVALGSRATPHGSRGSLGFKAPKASPPPLVLTYSQRFVRPQLQLNFDFRVTLGRRSSPNEEMTLCLYSASPYDAEQLQ